jgi:hypothetical protein
MRYSHILLKRRIVGLLHSEHETGGTGVSAVGCGNITVLVVDLTLVLLDTYITRMMYPRIGHYMRMSLTKLDNIVETIIIVPLSLSSLCRLLIVRLGGYLQTFIFHNMSVSSSTAVGRCSPHISNPKWTTCSTTLRITMNIDDTPITSLSHTHPSHSETSRLLTSSLMI